MPEQKIENKRGKAGKRSSISCQQCTAISYCSLTFWFLFLFRSVPGNQTTNKLFFSNSIAQSHYLNF